jgi:hypothetical protein
MLKVSQLTGFNAGAAGGPAEATFIGVATTATASAPDHTFASFDTGNITDGNAICIIVQGTAAGTISDVSVGGQSLTQVLESATDNQHNSEIWIGRLGLSGAQDIVVTASTFSSRALCSVGVYRIKNLRNLTPVDTHSTANTGPTVNSTVNTEEDGCIINGIQGDSSPTLAMEVDSVSIEDSDVTYDGLRRHAEGHYNGTDGTSTTVVNTIQGAADRCSVTASFR